MGLTDLLARAASTGIHVLVVEIPGYTVLRMRAEAAIVARGWTLAAAPADADILLVCGEPQKAYAEIIDAVWDQLPGPRHYEEIATTNAIPGALDTTRVSLRDRPRQMDDARQRPVRITGAPDTKHDSGSSHEHHDAGMEQHDESPGDQIDMDSMDMGGMDMVGPAGIPLASGDESDRDGLEMDVTHLTLGPILPDWPAGLVVECTLWGDVTAAADVNYLSGQESPSGVYGSPLVQVAEFCDAAGRLLAVAGWGPVAAKVLRLRDELLTGSAPGLGKVRTRLDRVARQVARSHTVAWSLAGIARNGVVDPRGRLLGWLRAAAALLDGAGEEPVDQTAPAGPAATDEWPETFDDIRQALIGQELSAARLLIASIPPARLHKLAAHTGSGRA